MVDGDTYIKHRSIQLKMILAPAVCKGIFCLPFSNSFRLAAKRSKRKCTLIFYIMYFLSGVRSVSTFRHSAIVALHDPFNCRPLLPSNTKTKSYLYGSHVSPCFVQHSARSYQMDSLRHFESAQRVGASMRRYNCWTRINGAQTSHGQYNRLVNNSNQRKQQQRRRSTAPKLEIPEVIFSNNHLLVVNKPPGWKSQPGEGSGSPVDSFDPKCLLTYLQKQGLGGGSQNDFLNPTHRLDQPCSGVLIFAKNAKAASRVQTAWSKRQIEKCYWVIVEGGKSNNHWRLGGLELLEKRSRLLPDGSFRLSAMVNNKTSRSGGKGSVTVKPVPPTKITKPQAISKKKLKNLGPEKVNDNANKDVDGRLCHIEWKHLERLPDTEYSTTRHLLSIKTDTGAKHQVRALLAIAGGAPIAGDLRYGDNILNINKDGGRVYHPLQDKSVALHARSVFLPTVSLGGMEFLKEKPFIADVPKSWKEWFGVALDT